VVLAQRLHRDALGEHQLVVALVVREGRQVELPRSQQLGEGSGTRRGVSDRCSEAGSLPRAIRRSATARCAAGRFTSCLGGTSRRLGWRAGAGRSGSDPVGSTLIRLVLPRGSRMGRAWSGDAAPSSPRACIRGGHGTQTGHGAARRSRTCALRVRSTWLAGPALPHRRAARNHAAQCRRNRGRSTG
jgi:hypothetical protein